MWAKSVESDNLSIHTATLRWMSVHPAPLAACLPSARINTKGSIV